MRYFMLKNNAGELLDITTHDFFFHEIGGLGFEEDNDFRQIGETWWLNHSAVKQATITGKMLFTEINGTDPYVKYREFYHFISKAPLVLLYYPLGPDSIEYRRRVRVSKLDKSEKNEYGVIDSDIDFVCYTPWYKVIETEYNADETADVTSGWIWGGDNNPPLVFEPSAGRTATRAKFRYELPQYLEINADTTQNCPIKLMIFGPVTNPVWSSSHKVDESFVISASGGFASSLSIASDEILVIDGTDGRYAMEITSLNGTFKQNVYQLRNFDTECFITLKEGENRISVTTSGGVMATHIKAEGHIYYATV